jgi:hypothetical protein
MACTVQKASSWGTCHHHRPVSALERAPRPQRRVFASASPQSPRCNKTMPRNRVWRQGACQVLLLLKACNRDCDREETRTSELPRHAAVQVALHQSARKASWASDCLARNCKVDICTLLSSNSFPSLGCIDHLPWALHSHIRHVNGVPPQQLQPPAQEARKLRHWRSLWAQRAATFLSTWTWEGANPLGAVPVQPAHIQQAVRPG